MNREQLRAYLERQVAKWSAKSYTTLREELREGCYTDPQEDSEYHVEVELLENRDEYVHVAVAVCSPKVAWSCYHPLSTSFLVHPGGTVKK